MKLWMTRKMTRIYRLETVRCNCYLLMKHGHNILIDTGLQVERNKLKKQLERLGVKKLDAIFLTHAHTDHAGNAQYFSRLYGCKVYIHQDELAMLNSGKCEMPGGMNIVTKVVSKVLHKVEIGTTFEQVKRAKIYPFPKEEKKKGFRRAEVSALGALKDLDLVVLETPGHTEGSVSIIVDHEIALVGDAFVHSFVGSIFPPFADGSEQKILTTWKCLLNTRCKLYCPAHGREVKRRLLLESLSVYHDKNEEGDE